MDLVGHTHCLSLRIALISFNSCNISASIKLLEASDAFFVFFFTGKGEDRTNSGASRTSRTS